MCMTQPKGLYRRHSPSPPLAALLWGRKYSNWTSRARWTQPETEGNVGRWARWCFVFQIFNWTSFTWGPREFPANPQPDPKMGNSWGLLKFPLATRKCDSSTKSIYWIRMYLIGDRISPNPGGHWSVEHAKRECEEGEGREGCPRKEFNFCLSFATQIFLYRVRKSDSARHGDWSRDFLCCCRSLHKLGKCLRVRERPLPPLRLLLINLL